MRIVAIARIEYKNTKGDAVEALPNQTFNLDDVEAKKLISIGAARLPNDGEVALAEKIESAQNKKAEKPADASKGGKSDTKTDNGI